MQLFSNVYELVHPGDGLGLAVDDDDDRHLFVIDAVVQPCLKVCIARKTTIKSLMTLKPARQLRTKRTCAAPRSAAAAEHELDMLLGDGDAHVGDDAGDDIDDAASNADSMLDALSDALFRDDDDPDTIKQLIQQDIEQTSEDIMQQHENAIVNRAREKLTTKGRKRKNMNDSIAGDDAIDDDDNTYAIHEDDDAFDRVSSEAVDLLAQAMLATSSGGITHGEAITEVLLASELLDSMDLHDAQAAASADLKWSPLSVEQQSMACDLWAGSFAESLHALTDQAFASVNLRPGHKSELSIDIRLVYTVSAYQFAQC